MERRRGAIIERQMTSRKVCSEEGKCRVRGAGSGTERLRTGLEKGGRA